MTKWEEYLYHKELIEETYKKKIKALKVLYPDQWKKDHKK